MRAGQQTRKHALNDQVVKYELPKLNRWIMGYFQAILNMENVLLGTVVNITTICDDCGINYLKSIIIQYWRTLSLFGGSMKSST